VKTRVDSGAARTIRHVVNWHKSAIEHLVAVHVLSINFAEIPINALSQTERVTGKV
jgi:hypothetical protein